MDLSNFNKRRKLIQDLYRQSQEVANALADSVNLMDVDSLADNSSFRPLTGRFWVLDEFLRTEACFGIALAEMDDMKTSAEDDKWLAPVDKEFNYFIKDILVPYMEYILSYARTMEFHDYRARNFAGEVTRKLGELRDWYAEYYNI